MKRKTKKALEYQVIILKGTSDYGLLFYLQKISRSKIQMFDLRKQGVEDQKTMKI